MINDKSTDKTQLMAEETLFKLAIKATFIIVALLKL